MNLEARALRMSPKNFLNNERLFDRGFSRLMIDRQRNRGLRRIHRDVPTATDRGLRRQAARGSTSRWLRPTKNRNCKLARIAYRAPRECKAIRRRLIYVVRKCMQICKK